MYGRLASLNGNAFFYQSEWGGGKEGRGACNLGGLHARATRGSGKPSLDARSSEATQAVRPR